MEPKDKEELKSKKSRCKCHSASCSDECKSSEGEKEEAGVWIGPAISFIMLVIGLVMEHFGTIRIFHVRWVELIWYLVAFAPVGLSVMREAYEGLLKKDYFNEFTLMTLASIGAFFIGEYPEAVAVMLFYCVGEILQDKAVDRVKDNIKKLLSLKAEKVEVIEEGRNIEKRPEDVMVGSEILVKPGERVALDSTLISQTASFDTSALTGESLPRTIESGETVLGGMIPLSVPVTLKVTKEYKDSTLSKIIKMVSEAAEKKSDYVKFITRFAKIYTPIVILLALALVLIPAVVSIFVTSFQYNFSEWLGRSLVFLVISCPCALVISVPLGYFVGIGAASRQGILVKGGNYLDIIRKVDAIAFDKTGTVTTGKLKVKDLVVSDMDKKEFLSVLAGAEASSTHPLAETIVSYARESGVSPLKTSASKEISGYGIVADIDGKKVIAGNVRILRKEGISYPQSLDEAKDTLIACAINGKFEGYVTFSDEIKPEAAEAIKELRDMGLKEMVILSGDNQKKVDEVASQMGLTQAKGELLPEGKSEYVRKSIEDEGKKIAYVGDGINDAPVLALSNVGIAMGGLGADIAVENADVIIQTDKLTKIAGLIKIGRITHTIIIENIVFAIAVKVIVLTLGAMGNVSLWAAVFADVGVSLIAIFNSTRIFWKVKRQTN